MNNAVTHAGRNALLNDRIYLEGDGNALSEVFKKKKKKLVKKTCFVMGGSQVDL